MDTPRNPCDQCKVRKIKCNYQSPCNRCQGSNLSCTRCMIRKKRGPKKGKGAVLDRMRVTYEGTATTSGEDPNPGTHTFGQQLEFPVLENDPGSIGFQNNDTTAGNNSFLTFDEFAQNVLADSNYFALDPHRNEGHDLTAQAEGFVVSPPLESNVYATPTTGFATEIPLPDSVDHFEVTPIIERMEELFFVHLYPIYPLIAQRDLHHWLQNPTALSRSEQTLVWSMCAMCLMYVDRWPNLGSEQRAVSARHFIRRCLKLRSNWEYVNLVSFEDILTSFFIGLTFFELKERKTSWFYVREAGALAVAAGLHDESGYVLSNAESRVRRMRTYALLYITERGAAIYDNFPVSIITPPSLPYEVLTDEDPLIASGLSSLHSLFSLLDFKFVRVWNDQGRSMFESDISADLLYLQTHLRSIQIDRAGLSDVQRADILITQQWLRLVFWQASLRQGLISSTADDLAFSYTYPIDIGLEMCEVVRSLPPIAIQVHGLGIFEKQFEVAYSLMDTMTLSGGSAQPEVYECLRYLLLSLSALPSSRQIYVRTLEKRMGGQQKYRNLAGVQLLRDDTKSQQNSRRQSTVYASRAAADGSR